MNDETPDANNSIANKFTPQALYDTVIARSHIYRLTLTGDITGSGLIVFPSAKSDNHTTITWFYLEVHNTRTNGNHYRLTTHDITGSPEWAIDEQQLLTDIRLETGWINADECEVDASQCLQAKFQFQGSEEFLPSSAVMYEAWDVDDGHYFAGGLELTRVQPSA